MNVRDVCQFDLPMGTTEAERRDDPTVAHCHFQPTEEEDDGEYGDRERDQEQHPVDGLA